MTHTAPDDQQPQSGLELDEKSDVLNSVAFFCYCYKVLPCAKRYTHDWSSCSFAHKNEKARRRDPRRYPYESVPCPDHKAGVVCPRGDACAHAHGVLEYWLHPSRFRTQVCQNGAACNRPLCFFAHSPEQLRFPESRFTSNGAEAGECAAADAAMLFSAGRGGVAAMPALDGMCAEGVAPSLWGGAAGPVAAASTGLPSAAPAISRARLQMQMQMQEVSGEAPLQQLPHGALLQQHQAWTDGGMLYASPVHAVRPLQLELADIEVHTPPAMPTARLTPATHPGLARHAVEVVGPLREPADGTTAAAYGKVPSPLWPQTQSQLEQLEQLQQQQQLQQQLEQLQQQQQVLQQQLQELMPVSRPPQQPLASRCLQQLRPGPQVWPQQKLQQLQLHQQQQELLPGQQQLLQQQQHLHQQRAAAGLGAVQFAASTPMRTVPPPPMVLPMMLPCKPAAAQLQQYAPPMSSAASPFFQGAVMPAGVAGAVLLGTPNSTSTPPDLWRLGSVVTTASGRSTNSGGSVLGNLLSPLPSGSCDLQSPGLQALVGMAARPRPGSCSSNGHLMQSSADALCDVLPVHAGRALLDAQCGLDSAQTLHLLSMLRL